MPVAVREHVSAPADDELRAMLRRNYMQRLIQYQTTAAVMRQKYGMNYEEFVNRDVVAKKNFAWEIESDSQDWEMALDGIRTIQRKLNAITGQ